MYEAVEAQGRPHASIVDGPGNVPPPDVRSEEGESALAIFDTKNTAVGCKRKVHVDGKKNEERKEEGDTQVAIQPENVFREAAEEVVRKLRDNQKWIKPYWDSQSKGLSRLLREEDQHTISFSLVRRVRTRHGNKWRILDREERVDVRVTYELVCKGSMATGMFDEHSDADVLVKVKTLQISEPSMSGKKKIFVTKKIEELGKEQQVAFWNALFRHLKGLLASSEGKQAGYLAGIARVSDMRMPNKENPAPFVRLAVPIRRSVSGLVKVDLIGSYVQEDGKNDGQLDDLVQYLAPRYPVLKIIKLVVTRQFRLLGAMGAEKGGFKSVALVFLIVQFLAYRGILPPIAQLMEEAAQAQEPSHDGGSPGSSREHDGQSDAQIGAQCDPEGSEHSADADALGLCLEFLQFLEKELARPIADNLSRTKEPEKKAKTETKTKGNGNVREVVAVRLGDVGLNMAAVGNLVVQGKKRVLALISPYDDKDDLTKSLRWGAIDAVATLARWFRGDKSFAAPGSVWRLYTDVLREARWSPELLGISTELLEIPTPVCGVDTGSPPRRKNVPAKFPGVPADDEHLWRYSSIQTGEKRVDKDPVMRWALDRLVEVLSELMVLATGVLEQVAAERGRDCFHAGAFEPVDKNVIERTTRQAVRRFWDVMKDIIEGKNVETLIAQLRRTSPEATAQGSETAPQPSASSTGRLRRKTGPPAHHKDMVRTSEGNEDDECPHRAADAFVQAVANSEDPVDPAAVAEAASRLATSMSTFCGTHEDCTKQVANEAVAIIAPTLRDAKLHARSPGVVALRRHLASKGSRIFKMLLAALDEVGREDFDKALDAKIADRLETSRETTDGESGEGGPDPPNHMVEIARQWKGTGVLEFFTDQLRNCVLVDLETQYATAWREKLVRVGLQRGPGEGFALPVRSLDTTLVACRGTVP